LQQLRSCVSNLRLIADITGSGDRDTKPDDSRHFIERSQVFSRDREDIERREMSRVAPGIHIELRADAPNEFRDATSVGSIPVRKSRLPVCAAST
jgi:hypothetical protein